MCYYKVKIEQERGRAEFERYIGDSLYCLNSRKYELPMSYSDYIDRAVETRTGDEIVAEVFQRAGLKVGE